VRPPTLIGNLVWTSHQHASRANFNTERDEKDAIDESNILEERTRGATKKSGTYAEPGDDEGLESVVDGNDGTSSGRQ
jgi:hypothetical protein